MYCIVARNVYVTIRFFVCLLVCLCLKHNQEGYLYLVRSLASLLEFVAMCIGVLEFL